MKKCILIVVWVSVSSSSLATPISGADWNEFYTAMNNGCVEKLTNISATTTLTVDQIKEFCLCTSKKIANSISYEDVDYMESTGDNSRLIAVTTSAGSACSY